MTLYKLVQDVCNLGKAQPNVNFVTQGDIYQLNHNQDVDYPAFVVTQGTHSGSDYDEEQFTLTLFAVDRLVSDKSNEIDVQSWANGVLLSVIKNIGDFYIGTVQSGFKIQTFTEKFDSLCAGAYVTLAINVDINDCDCVSKSIGFVTSVNGQTGDVTIKGYEGALVSSVNGQTGDVYLNIPYKVSDLRNDVPYASESFVNNKITDVSTYVSNNYLKKGEVPVLDNYYTKQEVDDKIRDVSVEIDLSNYYTKQEIDDKITDVSTYVTTYVYDNYYTIPEVDDKIRDVSVEIDLSNYYTKSEIYNKQEIETKIAQAGVSSVNSVNGQTGDVVLNYVDISVYNQHLRDYNSHLTGFNQYADDVDQLKDDFLVLDDQVNSVQYNFQFKQDTLVSGTNIKTINGLSLLGTGDIVINGGESTEHVNLTLTEYNNLSDAEKQNGKVYFITDIAYCLQSDYQALHDTVISLTNRVKVLENSIKSPQNNS